MKRSFSIGALFLGLFILFAPAAIGLVHYAYAQDAGTIVDAGHAAITLPTPLSPDSDALGFFQKLYENIRSGAWLPFAGGILIVITWLSLKLFPAVKGAGATLLTGGLAFLGSLGTAWFAGMPFDLKQLASAGAIAVVAMGGWAAIKNVVLGWLVPKIKALFSKA